MFAGARVLILEDEALIAMEMAAAVTAAEGEVAGPFASVKAALRFLWKEKVAAAILDANLFDRDVTPVALLLAERRIPAIIYTGIGLPPELRKVLPKFPSVLKPAGPEAVIRELANLMGLVSAPKH